MPILPRSRHEETNLVLFTDILSISLSDPSKKPDPVPEHTLDVVKSGTVPDLCNRVLNFITREKLSIFSDLLQHLKEPKIAWVCIC
jgi:hypothetical protein